MNQQASFFKKRISFFSVGHAKHFCLELIISSGVGKLDELLWRIIPYWQLFP